jgi:hypothetical protein
MNEGWIAYCLKFERWERGWNFNWKRAMELQTALRNCPLFAAERDKQTREQLTADCLD